MKLSEGIGMFIKDSEISLGVRKA